MPAEAAPIWILLGQLAEQAESITVANGYRTDIGLRVSREPEAQHAEDRDATPARLLVVLASEVPQRSAASQLRDLNFDVSLEASLPADSQDAQEQAHAALADLFDLHRQSRTYLQSATTTTRVTPGPGAILTRPDGLPIVVATLTLRCALTERLPPPTVLPPIGPP